MTWTPHAAVWSKRATRALERLDPPIQARIFVAVDRLCTTGQGDVKALKGEYAGRHRLRVGDWRVIVRLYHERAAVLVERVVPRGGAYD